MNHARAIKEEAHAHFAAKIRASSRRLLQFKSRLAGRTPVLPA